MNVPRDGLRKIFCILRSFQVHKYVTGILQI